MSPDDVPGARRQTQVPDRSSMAAGAGPVISPPPAWRARLAGVGFVVSVLVAAVSIVLWGDAPISSPEGGRLAGVLIFEMLFWGNIGTWLLLRRHERRLFSHPRPGTNPETQANRFAVGCGVAALATELTLIIVVSLPLALHAYGYERRQERRHPDQFPMSLPDPERARRLGGAALVVYGLLILFMWGASGTNG